MNTLSSCDSFVHYGNFKKTTTLLNILKNRSIIHLKLKHIHIFFFKFSVSRLEEKENESKNEYNKLHERYTEVCY